MLPQVPTFSTPNMSKASWFGLSVNSVNKSIDLITQLVMKKRETEIKNLFLNDS